MPDTIVLEGEIDQQYPDDYLDPFFADVIEQMGKSVTLDIAELDYINSLGIKCLVTFIVKRKANSKVFIKTNKSKSWQRMALKIIKSLDERNIIIE